MVWKDKTKKNNFYIFYKIMCKTNKQSFSNQIYSCRKNRVWSTFANLVLKAPLNEIALGQAISDRNNRMITLYQTSFSIEWS